MCGRYYVDDETMKEIEKILRNLDKGLNKARTEGDVFPTNTAAVVQSENEHPLLCDMIWGFPQYNKKGVIINTRSETALEKKTFSESTRHRRCIIPAKGFYEWDKYKSKVSFERPDGQAILLAGIWNIYGQDKRFTILTTDANESMVPVHSRMPLVLEQNEIQAWLDDDERVEFILRKRPWELSIVSGYVQQFLDFDS